MSLLVQEEERGAGACAVITLEANDEPWPEVVVKEILDPGMMSTGPCGLGRDPNADLGLGLWVPRYIVEHMHNGKMEAEVVSGWNRIRISLPMAH